MAFHHQTKSVVRMANNQLPDDIDFEALGREDNQPPQPQDDDIDFEALGRGISAGSQLATHRWTLRDIAAKRKKRLEEDTALDLYPTGGGPDGKMIDKRLFKDVKEKPKPKNLGEAIDQMTNVRATPLPTLPTIPSHYGPFQVPKAARFFGNIPIGATNLAPGTLNFAGDVAEHPLETARGLAVQIKAGGKAAAWAAAKAMAPSIIPELEAKGITPDDFNEMFLNDPIATCLMILGGVEGLRRGVGGVRKFAGPIDTSVPSYGDFDFSGIPPEEPQAALRSLALQQQLDHQKRQAALGEAENLIRQWQDRQLSRVNPLETETPYDPRNPNPADLVRGNAPQQSVPTSDEFPPRQFGPTPELPPRSPLAIDAPPNPDASIEVPNMGPQGIKVEPRPPSFLDTNQFENRPIGSFTSPLEKGFNDNAIKSIHEEFGNRGLDIDPRVQAWYERNAAKLAEAQGRAQGEDMASPTGPTSRGVVTPVEGVPDLTKPAPKQLGPRVFGLPEMTETAKAELAAKEALVKKATTKGRRKGGKATLSFLGTHEFEALLDVAIHHARRIPTYAKWVGEMVKSTGIKSAEVLKHLWDQTQAVLAGIKKAFSTDPGPPETEQAMIKRLLENPPGELTPEDLDIIRRTNPMYRRIEENYQDLVKSREPQPVVPEPGPSVSEVNQQFLDRTRAIEQAVQEGKLSPEDGAAQQRELGRQFIQDLNKETPTPEGGMISEERRKAVQDFEGPERRTNSIPIEQVRGLPTTHLAPKILETKGRVVHGTPFKILRTVLREGLPIRNSEEGLATFFGRLDRPGGYGASATSVGGFGPIARNTRDYIHKVGIGRERFDERVAFVTEPKTMPFDKNLADVVDNLVNNHPEFQKFWQGRNSATYAELDTLHDKIRPDIAKELSKFPQTNGHELIALPETHRLAIDPNEIKAIIYDGPLTKVIPELKAAKSNVPVYGSDHVLRYDPAKIQSKKGGGTTLSMLGSQEMYERLASALASTGKALAAKYPDFLEWSKAMRQEAAKYGATLSDDMLRKVWNNPQTRQQPTVAEAINTTIGTIQKGDTETGSERKFGRPLFDTLRRITPEGWKDHHRVAWADSLLNFTEDAWLSRLGSSPSMSRVRAYLPKVYDAAYKVSVARGAAYIRALTHFHKISKILPTKELRNLFADLILDDRARALDEKQQQIADRLKAIPDEIAEAKKAGDDQRVAQLEEELKDTKIPPNSNIPKMEDTARQAAIDNPQISQAIDYWRQQVLPEVESFSNDLNIHARLTGPLGLYNRMRWVDAAQFKETRELRDRDFTGYGKSTATKSPYDVSPRPSPSRKTATGVGPEGTMPENSIFHMLHSTYDARLPSIAVAELRAAIRELALPDKQRVTRLGNRLEPLTNQPLMGTGDGMGHNIPVMAADAYNNVMSAGHVSAFSRVWQKIANAATIQAIMVPAEAVRHATNVIQVLTTISAKNPSMAESAVSASTFGMSRVVRGLHQAWNLEGDALAAKLKDLADGGALRLRGYEGYAPEQTWMMKAAHKVTGPLKDLVFGDPGLEKGISGLETRLRVVLWDMIKERHPNASNIELGRLVNDAMGTYVTPLVPGLGKALGPVDPFIRAGVSMTKVGLKQMVGVDVSGKFSPWNLTATYGTLAAAYYYNTLMDEKGRPAHKIPGYRPTYLFYWEKNGRRYSVDLSDIMGPLSRASNFTGIRGLAEGIRNGASHPSDLVEDYSRSIVNTFLSRTGQIYKDLLFHPFLKEPYLTATGLLPAGEASMAGAEHSPTEERLKVMAKGAVPWFSRGVDVGRSIVDPTGDIEEADIVLPEDRFAHVVYRVNEMFKVPGLPKLHNITEEKPFQQYRTQAQFEDTVADVVSRARRLSSDKRTAFIQEKIARNFSNDIVTYNGKYMPAKAAARMAIMQRLGRGQASSAKGMALQNINKEQ